ncbi:MAG: cytochrome c [Leptospira sp.]|nr:cytochrome c [Leptospira sp.]
MKLISKIFLLVFYISLHGSCANDPTETQQPIQKQELPPRITVPRDEALFRQNGCESCHGKYGSGDTTENADRKFPNGIPDLRNKKEYKYGSSLSAISKTIRNGIPNTQMRPYQHLKEEEIKTIAKYVLELQKIR